MIHTFLVESQPEAPQRFNFWQSIVQPPGGRLFNISAAIFIARSGCSSTFQLQSLWPISKKSHDLRGSSLSPTALAKCNLFLKSRPQAVAKCNVFLKNRPHAVAKCNVSLKNRPPAVAKCNVFLKSSPHTIAKCYVSLMNCPHAVAKCNVFLKSSPHTIAKCYVSLMNCPHAVAKCNVFLKSRPPGGCTILQASIREAPARRLYTKDPH